MANFTYKAIDTSGKSIMGQIEALNIVDLEMRLKRMGLDLVRGAPSKRSGSVLRAGSIKRPELINFCFHLEQLNSAGVPLIEALVDLRDSVENPRFREVISGVAESIQGGRGFSQALAEYPDVFEQVFTSLVKAGEDTGKLPEVLKSLAETLRWEDELAAQSKKIVMYPLFVGSIVLAVFFFLMIYVVPQMVGFIKNMGSTIPLQTRILIQVSFICVNYWYLILGIPVAVFFALKFAIQVNPRARYHNSALRNWRTRHLFD